MADSISIRLATPEDAAALRAIYEYYVLNTAITYEYEVPSASEFGRRISHTLEKHPYFVAEEDGEILGYVYAEAFGSRAAFDWAVETAIYLNRNARRRGIGRMLYAALEEALESMGVRNLYARVAIPSDEPDPYLNRDSEKFHEKLGYRTVGELNKCGSKFGRWYNLAYMEKTLGDHEADPQPVIPFPAFLTGAKH